MIAPSFFSIQTLAGYFRTGASHGECARDGFDYSRVVKRIREKDVRRIRLRIGPQRGAGFLFYSIFLRFWCAFSYPFNCLIFHIDLI